MMHIRENLREKYPDFAKELEISFDIDSPELSGIEREESFQRCMEEYDYMFKNKLLWKQTKEYAAIQKYMNYDYEDIQNLMILE